MTTNRQENNQVLQPSYSNLDNFERRMAMPQRDNHISYLPTSLLSFHPTLLRIIKLFFSPYSIHTE